MNFNILYRGGPRIFERGGQIRSTIKKGGGAKRGSNFGPNVKKPTSWHKREGPDPLTPPPPPPGSATDCRPRCMRCATISIHQSLILGTMNRRIQSVATAHTANSRADLWFAEATFLVSRPYISCCCRQPPGWQGLYSLSIVSRIQESRELIIES